MHHVRDQTMGEDASRVRKRSGPATLATMRNVARRAADDRNRAARMRTFCCDPVKASDAIRQN